MTFMLQQSLRHVISRMSRRHSLAFCAAHAQFYHIYINDLVTEKYVFNTLKRNSSSSYMSCINSKSILEYSRYLLEFCNKLRDHLEGRQSATSFQWPSLLLDELGGNPNLAAKKLKSVAEVCEELQFKEDEFAELSCLVDESSVDDGFQAEVKKELSEITNAIEDYRFSLVDMIVLDKELEECEGAILEVHAGVGGEEAMLFASELYQMYLQFCNHHGLQVIEIDRESENDSGLLKASVSITSEDGFAYCLLRHEAGVHRVQRVPRTESRGRIHTSTASVVVIPKHDTSSFKVNPNDIKKHFGYSPGAGGQHANKTLSCALVRHLPTGIQIKCHATRFQQDNLRLALEQLTQILYKRYMDSNKTQVNSVRAAQTKSRERSDKIRTYNFHQNRITDHRIGYSMNGIEAFLSGGNQFEILANKLEEKCRNDEKVAVMNALMKEAGIS